MAGKMAERRLACSKIVEEELAAGANIPRIIKEVELRLRIPNITAREMVHEVLDRLSERRTNADDLNLKLTVLESHLIGILEMAKKVGDVKTALATVKELRIVWGVREGKTIPEGVPDPESVDEPAQTVLEDDEVDLASMTDEQLRAIATNSKALVLTSAQADAIVRGAESEG